MTIKIQFPYIPYKFILLCCIVNLLSACGFHLRGFNNTEFKFPFQSVYVDCANTVICQNFKTVIETDDLATLTSKPESAEVIIKLLNEQTSRDAQGFNSAGRIAAFVLTYQIQAQVWQNHRQLGDTLDISTQTTLQYNDATILSNNQEEAILWNELHVNATNQLVRRLVYFNYRNYSIDQNNSNSYTAESL
ncbi:MAG: LPS-assembly lipoprotein [Pseudomonadota bacterium]|nr:LPS-assembly lipoprotein [Pseudomonadota bacterium]